MHRTKLDLNCMEKKLKFFEKKQNSNFVVNTICTKFRALVLPITPRTKYLYNFRTQTLTLVYTNVLLCGANLSRIFYELLYNMSRLWYTKISFKGKGFKIKKRRRTKTIKFFFYHSHVNAVILKKSKFKQKKKNRILIKFWHYRNFKKTEEMITHIRGLNIFTKRGLRAGRQLVLKKTGKKSNY